MTLSTEPGRSVFRPHVAVVDDVAGVVVDADVRLADVRDQRLGDLAGGQQTAVGLQADVDAVPRRFVGERADALQERRALILETAAGGVGVAAGRGRDLGDPELAGQIERLAELRHALVADEIGVPGEADRRQAVLGQQVLDPLDLGIVGVAADVLGPAGDAGQLDGS